MPVLECEQWILPENLFDESFGESDRHNRWRVIHTRSRCEKSLARILAKNEIRFFLPVYEQKKKYQRRLVHSWLPLFSGYLFIHCDNGDLQNAAVRSQCVSCLEVADQKEFFDQLTGIHRLVRSGRNLSPEAHLSPGQFVEITNGPLKGCRGKLIRRQGSNDFRFTMEVNFIQQGVSVEVESTDIRPLT